MPNIIVYGDTLRRMLVGFDVRKAHRVLTAMNAGWLTEDESKARLTLLAHQGDQPDSQLYDEEREKEADTMPAPVYIGDVFRKFNASELGIDRTDARAGLVQQTFYPPPWSTTGPALMQVWPVPADLGRRRVDTAGTAGTSVTSSKGAIVPASGSASALAPDAENDASDEDAEEFPYELPPDTQIDEEDGYRIVDVPVDDDPTDPDNERVIYFLVPARRYYVRAWVRLSAGVTVPPEHSPEEWRAGMPTEVWEVARKWQEWASMCRGIRFDTRTLT